MTSRPAWLVQPRGPIDYDVANAAMHALAERRLADQIPDTLIVLEHPSFTFHGPGQLVGYPILGLGARPDAARYLRRLEEAVIRTCAELGARVHRRDDVQTGVWAGDEKICAIGVRLLRTRVTLHGFALNCDTDLSWFDGIVACGLPAHGVTSLSRLLDRDVTVEEVRPIVVRHLGEVFDLAFSPSPPEIAAGFRTADVA